MIGRHQPLNLTRTAAPADEPVTLAEAKAHLRVDLEDDDALITSLISAAREWAETFTDRQFITATYELRLDDFPRYAGDTINLPRPNLLAVSSIVYTDTDRVPQTVAPTAYQVDIHSQPGRIRPVYGTMWPFLSAHLLAPIVITYTAGYGALPADVPLGIQQAIKIIVSDLYEGRESTVITNGQQLTVPFAATALLGPFRVMTVV